MNANVNYLTAAINLSLSETPYACENMVEEARNMLQELIQLDSLMNTRCDLVLNHCTLQIYPAGLYHAACS